VRSLRISQTASHWGVYRVQTDPRTGEILSTTGAAFDPHPSPLQAGLPETVRDHTRIDRPYVREGYLRSRGSNAARAPNPSCR
jgi:biotin/methionine sulfoxide reductase